MARVKHSFIESHLINKILSAVEPLNYVMDALDPSEDELIAEIKEIIQRIIHIEI